MAAGNFSILVTSTRIPALVGAASLASSRSQNARRGSLV
jgi:hypothetical protein